VVLMVLVMLAMVIHELITCGCMRMRLQRR
jgi:hypothetical protein